MLGVNRAADQTGAEPSAANSVVHHQLAAEAERLGALAELVIRHVDQALRNAARREVFERGLGERLETVGREIAQAVSGRPVL